MGIKLNGKEYGCYQNGRKMGGYVSGAKMFGKKTMLGIVCSKTSWLKTKVLCDTDIFDVKMIFKHSSTSSTIPFANNNWKVLPGFMFYINWSNGNLHVGNEGVIGFNVPSHRIVKTNFAFDNINKKVTADVNGVVKVGSFPNGSITNLTTSVLISNSFNFSTSPFVLYRFELIKDGVPAFNGIPVRQGSTQYSDTPAPSNCMWDDITKQYFQSLGSTPFEIEETEVL